MFKRNAILLMCHLDIWSLNILSLPNKSPNIEYKWSFYVLIFAENKKDEITSTFYFSLLLHNAHLRNAVRVVRSETYGSTKKL